MRSLLMLPALLLFASVARADDGPCKSGLREKQRPGPYTSIVAVGPQRGQSHCFVCEAEDRPVVIIFARQLSEPLGKLVQKLDKALADNKELRAWVTFLAEDQASFDPKVVQWSKKSATGKVPLGIFDDPVGPPTYLLAREADITILFSVNKGVIANFAFRAGELNDTLAAEVLKALPRILPPKK